MTLTSHLNRQGCVLVDLSRSAIRSIKTQLLVLCWSILTILT
jgi:hypothetical protein